MEAALELPTELRLDKWIDVRVGCCVEKSVQFVRHALKCGLLALEVAKWSPVDYNSLRNPEERRIRFWVDLTWKCCRSSSTAIGRTLQEY